MAAPALKRSPLSASAPLTRTKTGKLPASASNTKADTEKIPKRRTSEQVKADAEQQERALDQAKKDSEQAISNAASVEDDLRREDLVRKNPVNRQLEATLSFTPTPLEKRNQGTNSGDMGRKSDLLGQDTGGSSEPSSDPPTETLGAAFTRKMANINAGANESSGSEDEEFRPENSAEDEDEDDEDGESEDSDSSGAEVEVVSDKRKAPSKKGRSAKPTKVRRADVQSHRSYVVEPTVEPKKSKKAAANSKRPKKDETGISDKWTPGQKFSKSTTKPATAASASDSMVQYGGFASDNEGIEDDEAEGTRTASKSKIKTAKAQGHQIVKIKPGHTLTQPLTKKERRGGDSKWALRHLPAGIDHSTFTKSVAPLARLKAGTLSPWSLLEVSHVQEVVDSVYGEGEITVEDDDVWCGLITQRLNNWRNGFATVAATGLKSYIEENTDIFQSPEDIADTVSLYLSEHGIPAHCPFWWREWVQDEATGAIQKKGMFQHSLIMYTLAHAHFVDYGGDIPDPATLEDKEKPMGAVILALQAVHHAFKAWSTGSFVVPSTHFSMENYGDYSQKQARGTGAKKKMVSVIVPRATKFVPTVRALTDRHWAEIFSAVHEHLEATSKTKKRRRVSASASASEVSIEKEDFNHMFGSKGAWEIECQT